MNTVTSVTSPIQVTLEQALAMSGLDCEHASERVRLATGSKILPPSEKQRLMNHYTHTLAALSYIRRAEEHVAKPGYYEPGLRGLLINMNREREQAALPLLEVSIPVSP